MRPGRLVVGLAVLAAPVCARADQPPRLAGTVVAGAARVAIFSLDGSDQAAEEGDQVAGYTVARVRPGQVELHGPAGMVVIRPSSGPDTPLAADPPAPLWDPISDK